MRDVSKKEPKKRYFHRTNTFIKKQNRQDNSNQLA